jgi:hypothetical protein
VEIAERALEFFAFLVAAGLQQRADEIHEIAMREWLFEEVNRAEAGGFLALGGEMDGRQDNGASVWVAGAEIVEEFLAEIVGGVDVEDEEIGLLAADDVLRLLEAVSDIDVGSGGGFVERGPDSGGEVAIGREHQDAAAGLSSDRMRRGLLVQNTTG